MIAALNLGAIKQSSVDSSEVLAEMSVEALAAGSAGAEFNMLEDIVETKLRSSSDPRPIRPSVTKDLSAEVTPFESSRARTLDGGYVNASKMPGAHGRSYIAAQGPLRNTISDFWSMIVNHGVHEIVSLCGDDECACYVPTQDQPLSLLRGALEVSLLREETVMDSVVRQYLEVQHAGESRLVTRLHCTAWVDQGTISPATILSLAELVTADGAGGTTAVHCKAGVGRTGVLLALCSLLESCKHQKKALGAMPRVSIASTVVNMRMHRPHMVQTADQYRLLHSALAEWLRCA